MFALVDCNNFYASCERVFNPALEGKPIVILSNNDGCVIARSNEAKKLGIPMGAPYFQWRDVCEKQQVHVFSSNYELYGDMSQRIMISLKMLCEHLEIYSIDEAFIELPPLNAAATNDYAHHLKHTIKTWTGIPVSIGIGPTKTLAKLANQVAKKSGIGIFDLANASNPEEILANFAVEDIWGIGRNLAAKLKQIHIHSAKQLRDSNPKILRQQFSVVMERMIQELHGIACLPLTQEVARKEIISSRSFGKRVYSKDELAEALSHYTAIACLKLRQQHSVANGICIYLHTKDNIESLPYFFPTPSADTCYIIKIAKMNLQKLYRQGQYYRKAGVALLNLQSDTIEQMDLFTETTHPKENRIMDTLDTINQRLGKNTLFICAEGTEKNWQMKRHLRSPRYTTCWEELAIAQSHQ